MTVLYVCMASNYPCKSCNQVNTKSGGLMLQNFIILGCMELGRQIHVNSLFTCIQRKIGRKLSKYNPGKVSIHGWSTNEHSNCGIYGR